MNKTLLIILILVVFSCKSPSNEKRIEEVYQECAYNTLLDKGKSLKHYAKGYEKYLINIQVLKDSTARSYHNLFKSMCNGKVFEVDSFSFSFSDSINLNRSERMKFFPVSTKCSKEIILHKDYIKFRKRLTTIFDSEDKDLKEILKNYSELLNEEDFNLDYYKLQTLIFIDLAPFVFDK